MVQTIAALYPRILVGDECASNPVTVVARHGGYDLVVGTEIAGWAVSLESSYLGSEQAGYLGSHLLLSRAEHRFLAPTRIEPLTQAWWPTALLDHYAVLQDQLGHGARVQLADRELIGLH